MKSVLILSVVSFSLWFASPPSALADSGEQPSKASVHALLEVMQTHTVIDQYQGYLLDSLKVRVEKTMAGQPMSQEQQEMVAELRTKVIVMYKKQRTWESIRPIYVQAYRESYSQEEIDAMLDFYRSAVGQAVIDKQPLILNKTDPEFRQRVNAVWPKVEQILRQSD